MEQLADLIDRVADLPALEARVAELELELIQRQSSLGQEIRRLEIERDALAKRLEIIEALAVNLLRLARGEPS